MSDTNFQPIFDYLDTNLGEIKTEIKNLQENQLITQTAISNLSAQVKQYHEEMLVTGHRMDRIEAWAMQVGQKIGVPITF
jgi:uncharacterized protein YlxW (UPF0749 family)